MLIESSFNFKDLFVLDMANNHQGDIEHGYRIIDEHSKIVNKHNVEFKILPMDIMKEFLKIAKEVVLDNAEKDPVAMKVHTHYQEFLKKAIDITKYQELGYLNAREMANKA